MLLLRLLFDSRRQQLPAPFGDALHLKLDGYEHRIIELRPLAAGEVRLAGVRYTVIPATNGEVSFKVYAPEGANVVAELSKPAAFNEASVDGEKVEIKLSGQRGALALHFGKKLARETTPKFSAPTIRTAVDGVVRVAITVEVPADFHETKASLLLESAAPGLEVKAEARDNSKPLSVAVVKSPKGAWQWFTVDLAPGSHALEFDLHIPAGSLPGTQLSGWLRAKRTLVAKNVRLKLGPGQKLDPPPRNLLPAATEIEKLTYALFEETPL